MSKRTFVGLSTGLSGGLTGCSYNVRASELATDRTNNKDSASLRCLVYFLDETQHTFEIDRKARGQILLDLVFQHLELIERDYFGLQYADTHASLRNGHNYNINHISNNSTHQSSQQTQLSPSIGSSISNTYSLPKYSDAMRWLDPCKQIRKQIKGPPYLLYFKVRFYVSDSSKLHEEYTRYHFCLQIKKDILDGKLLVPLSSSCLLASFIAQSELGDYTPEEHKRGYLSELRLLPNQNEEIEAKICEFHQLHKGQTPADAEYNYLDHAKRLDMYGVELHRARDSTESEIELGVCASGIIVFQNSIKLNTFSWAKIIKISFKRKHFFIQLRREGTERFDSMLGFNLQSYRACKNLWKSCVEHHTFFRLQSPKPQTKRFFFFFNLGSKFRYSGKTEYQTIQESKNRTRTERNFIRATSRRFGRQTVPILSSPRNPNGQSSTSPRNSAIWSSTKLTNGITPTSTSPSGRNLTGSAHVCCSGGSASSSGTHYSHYQSNHLQQQNHRPLDSFTQKIHESPNRSAKPAWGLYGCSADDHTAATGVSSSATFRPNALNFKNVPYIDSSSLSSKEPSVEKPIEGSSISTKVIVNGTSSDSSSNPTLRLSSFSDESPSQLQPPQISIRMRPDEQGRFGFNVKGGADQNLPVLVSRVAPNTPADNAIPKLNEGDQVMSINNTDVDGLTHDEVVKLIRSTKEQAVDGELILSVRPNVYTRNLSGQQNGDNESNDEPSFEYIPVDASPLTRIKSQKDRLHQSIMLLYEALESGAIIGQFEQIYRKKSGEFMNEARLPDNICKNRYRDISPYDSTRVILNNCYSGDYINASFVNMEIPTSGIINRYIATQGPLSSTCDEFWQMIWEQKSMLVIMVTPLVERDRPKCHKYWPDLNVSQAYGNLNVYNSSEKGVNAMVEREFKLTDLPTGESRDVIHIQYVAWPDHAVPDDPSDFLDLVFKVKHHRAGFVEPVTVHCSAGIGRTGVLILMETAMCLIQANEPVYPIEILKSMRDQRAMLIQTSSQFRFVCEAILRVYNERIVTPLSEFRR